MIELLPKIHKEGKSIPALGINTILFHDKNPVDLSFNYPVLEKTCGVCHQQQVDELKKTAMGHNSKQRQYPTWTGERGPHNCGVWFVDGYDQIAENTKIAFTKEASLMNQKACNTCHVGCLTATIARKRKTTRTRHSAHTPLPKKYLPSPVTEAAEDHSATQALVTGEGVQGISGKNSVIPRERLPISIIRKACRALIATIRRGRIKNFCMGR